MRRAILSTCLVVLLAVGLVVAGLAYYGYQAFKAPGLTSEETLVLIRRGSSLDDIAEVLTESGVISDPMVFGVAARLSEKARRLKAGEYAIPAGASMEAVLVILASGRTIARSLTVPEGLTSVEIVRLIEEAPALVGAVAEVPPQGSLLPETYHYSFGDDRAVLLQRMSEAMERTLGELWPQRQEGLPLESPQEALALASIVEKETGIADERPLVASVFINRLRRGMPLQSDPTVIFALTEGEAPLGRALTRRDWRVEHPYNTYVIPALPPGPIANPGRAAIAAVLQPAESDYLYFVAAGDGGHAFAKTLREHNRNVRQWRRIRDGN